MKKIILGLVLLTATLIAEVSSEKYGQYDKLSQEETLQIISVKINKKLPFQMNHITWSAVFSENGTFASIKDVDTEALGLTELMDTNPKAIEEQFRKEGTASICKAPLHRYLMYQKDTTIHEFYRDKSQMGIAIFKVTSEICDSLEANPLYSEYDQTPVQDILKQIAENVEANNIDRINEEPMLLGAEVEGTNYILEKDIDYDAEYFEGKSNTQIQKTMEIFKTSDIKQFCSTPIWQYLLNKRDVVVYIDYYNINYTDDRQMRVTIDKFVCAKKK